MRLGCVDPNDALERELALTLDVRAQCAPSSICAISSSEPQGKLQTPTIHALNGGART